MKIGPWSSFRPKQSFRKVSVLEATLVRENFGKITADESVTMVEN